MHLLMIVLGLSITIGLRSLPLQFNGSLVGRWQRTLGLFLFPPLLLLMTAIAVLLMGPHGWMVWRWEGWLSYGLAIGFLSWALVLFLKLVWEGQRTLQQTHRYPQINLNGNPARLLDITELYSARVGFWQPELVVSQGLLDQLDNEHLEAVLVHEQAHLHYRDTFWFFWLGWVRRLTFWLPQTETLWEELLALRELRADRWAVQQVDPLLLAESLLVVVSAPLVQSEICAAFAWATQRDRLTERIDSLFAESELPDRFNFWTWSWLVLVCLPLVAIPFHT
jgi:Zn-dependent protease with chaperone function